MLVKLVSTMVIVSSLTVGCGSATFFGSGSSGKKDGNNPNSPQQEPGSSSETNGNNTGPGAPGAPGYTPLPGANGDCPNPPCAPKQDPQYGPRSEIEVTPEGINFGKDHVFHIGNGQFKDSTCREEIAQLPLSGSIYFFQFEVTADNTQVDINMARACGIDYSSGTVQLAKGFRKIGSQTIAPGITSLSLPKAALNRGVHTVYVYAGKGDGIRGAKWDIDDFIIGQVQIRANQPIKPGRYGTYR
jgi:hypothetical protein